MKIGVIGSGVSGLAVAIRLARQGHAVTIHEKNDYVGGKIHEFNMSGYRFDRGPSISTLPHLVDELFELYNLNPRNYFNYTKLSLIGKFFFSDRTVINGYSNIEDFTNELKSKLQIDSNIINEYLNEIKKIDTITGFSFLSKPIHSLKTHLNFKSLYFILQQKLLRMFQPMHSVNKEKLKHPKLVQLFDRYATYVGSNPYEASGILRSIGHLEFGKGSYTIHNGFIGMKNALHELAKHAGVSIILNSSVTAIKHSKKQIKGLIANDNFIQYDAIVSNMDIHQHYLKIEKSAGKQQKISKTELSSSMVVFYWGMNREFPELDTHNTFFSSDYQHEFNHIFKLKTLSNDPTIYINITSKQNKKDAPQGCENWFVMINSPHNDGQNWKKLVADLRVNVLKKLSSILQVDIANHIVCEDVLHPEILEKETNSFKGALYGPSSNKINAAFLRHQNTSKTINGLYFCGGTVHPGGGTPLCFLSAKITSELVK